jgi:alkanesulfonate monooxygenase SsuD/methylene tetrahydromethanopterin reductase-like flavin-dependent oxidoreductase (luciferase family)
MRGMLHGERPSAMGPRYKTRAVRNDPPPIQDRLPLLVGGGGERVTLKLVARYADGNNVGGGLANVKRKEAILLQHCETVGRDPSEIERTVGVGAVTIRDSRAEAQQVAATIFERNGGARPGSTALMGTPEQVAEAVAPYLEIGYRHLIADFPAPHDEQSMTRFATDVRALLERG